LLGAFTISAASKSTAYQQELRELAVAEHLDAYKYGNDLKLMWQLSTDPAWIQMINAFREVSDVEETGLPNVAAMPLEQREQLLKELPVEQREQLNSRWERFSRLEPAEQERILATAEAVSQQANPESLLQTMIHYAQWRESIQDTELRDRIESADPAERQEAIQLGIERTQQSIARRSGVMLDDQTIESIMKALRLIVKQRIDRGDEQIVTRLSQLRKIPGLNDPEFLLIFDIVRMRRSFGGSRNSRPSPGGREASNPPFDSALAPLQSDELDIIQYSLSHDAAKFFEATTGGYPSVEAMTLEQWAQAAIRRKYQAMRGPEPSLLDRYQSLKLAEGDVIDLLPPLEIVNQLSRER
jgi:hypothetical protein